MTDKTRLEDAFRACLQHRAHAVDTTADLLGPARSAARRRRRRAWVAGSVGLAAAALVTAAVVQSVGEEPDRGTQVADPSTEPLPTEWRTEAWHGLQVEVPADWGWGVAPTTMSFDVQTQLLCGGPGALVGPDGRHLVNAVGSEPWVGRPVMASDDCAGEPFAEPEASYVWLGAELEPGMMDVGNGYLQETVEVGGTTLTVATDNPALTRRILDSVKPVAGCQASLAEPPSVDFMLIEGLREPTSAQVCAYRRERGASSWDLVYATTLGEREAAAYHAAVYDGGFESSPEFCGEGADERVLITITGDDPYGGDEVTQATVVDPTCREVQGSPGMVSPLSDTGMEAWSRNGARVTLYGLIGPQG